MSDLRKRMEKEEEALDFTSAKMKRSSREEASEPPILDLSCKKANSSSCSLSPVSIEGVSSPVSIDRPIEETTSERKSPFEGRNLMVTPPSEIDSPRKIRYESAYGRQVDGVTTSMAPSESEGQYAMLPMVPAASILSSEQNVVDATSQLQLPVSTTTSTSSLPHDVVCPVTLQQETTKKAPRPFKAYPKDPLTMMSVGSAEILYDQTSTEAYSEFRKRMLESVRRTNEGTNVKMRRVSKSPTLPTSTIMDEKDAAYWERRRKNNEAAKRSRDARRAKEDEIAIRAAFLEQENMRLKYEIVTLRNETAKLRCMVYTN